MTVSIPNGSVDSRGSPTSNGSMVGVYDEIKYWEA